MNKDLLTKYFRNSCSPEELAEVEEFLKQPDSSDLIRQVIDEQWATFEAPKTEESVLDTYRQHFITDRMPSSPKKIKPFWQGEWLKYAAVLFLVMGIGYYMLLSDRSIKPEAVAFLEYNNPLGQRSVLTLTDSTVVYLGAGSWIRLPQKFTGNTREITLEGEAFFQVKKDPAHPFIIHTGLVQTRVLGTSFKIEAFRGRLLSVSVATGKVRVERKEEFNGHKLSSLAVLTPGYKVLYDEITKKAAASGVIITDLEQWKDGGLVFNGLRLDEVAMILERQYNVKITIASPSIAAYKINAAFKANEPITKIMRIISATAKFNYNIKVNTIKISKI